jgi:hypothetical protein
MFSDVAAASPEDIRRRLYAGNIFKLPATSVTTELVAYIRQLAEDALGGPLANAHERFDFDGAKQKLAPLRAALASEPRYVGTLTSIASVIGASSALAFDPLRLRCSLHGRHEGPGTETAYAIHRDTWYANPQCQINFWIPLHDVTEEQTFTFFPHHFNAPIRNTSSAFSYDDWITKRGWQSSKANVAVAFPLVLEEPTPGQAFKAKSGDIIVFSASQLHQTIRNDSGITRFSLDFRAVHLGDHGQGLGAPNVDNGSRPDALRDYLFPGNVAA